MQQADVAVSLLPVEIWEAILQHIPRDALQHTALSLSRAVPDILDESLLLRYLFRDIRIHRDTQTAQLIRRLGPRFSDAATAKLAVESFTSLAWR